jgi:cytochrome c biogenesis protein CcmG/thiol:disulfide interchange protein DsbE
MKRSGYVVLLLLLVAAGVVFAQSAIPPSVVTPATAPAQAAPATSAAPAAPPSPVSGIRNKIAADDLLSAESILEVHKAKYGEDGPWLNGYGWLARGALLLGETDKAKRYAEDVRAICAKKIAGGADPAKDHDLEIALGAAIEVKAQLIEKTTDTYSLEHRLTGGAKAATDYVRGELAQLKGAPVAFRSRLNKRIDMMTLVGQPAPELIVYDWLGEKPSTLASLKGKPVLMFVWAEWCGDCKAQAAVLAAVRKRHAHEGLQVLALTRFYDDDSLRVKEKARVDSVWNAVYPDVGTIPIVFSTASMERYGGSSTPTFVFVDRAGIVRRYTPTRLTESEMERTVGTLLR